MTETQQHTSAAAAATAGPSRPGRRLAVRIATPVAVAAAAVGAFLALTPSTTAVAGHTPAATGAAAGSHDTRISTVAYTLTEKSDGTVLVAVHKNAAVDAAQLQKDLAKVGITAKVTKGWPLPSDHIQVVSKSVPKANGDYVVTIVRDKRETVIFKLATGETSMSVLPTAK